MRIEIAGAALTALVWAFVAPSTQAQNVDLLTGTPALACEALLCLSSGTRPGECAPSLDHYFGINHRKLSDTLDARRAFLLQCPTVSADTALSSLAHALSQGAGRCDAKSLNRTLSYAVDTDSRPYIGNQLPGYCQAMFGTPYTADLAAAAPVYIGTPQDHGYWVEPENYERELRRYEEQLERDKQQMDYGNGGA